MNGNHEPKPLRVLLIQDDSDDAVAVEGYLRVEGYAPSCHRVMDPDGLRVALDESWDVVISDYLLPSFTALGALEILREKGCDLPFIVVTGLENEELACQVMQAGAQDYLPKDRLPRLTAVIERERAEARLRREHRAAVHAATASDERFQALAANVPGVLFQIHDSPDGYLRFTYVSEASQMLLGMPAEALCNKPDALLALIVEEDRQDFLAALSNAAERSITLNWEGRVQPAGADIKWINLRGSPRPDSPDGRTWEGVMWNITQSKLAEAELRASRAQLAALSDHLQRAKEEERERIARDIHDVLGGTLVGIKISASLLGAKLEQDPALRERLRGIEAMLDDAIATAGRVARELRPGILKEFGLAAAVESCAEDFQHRTGIPCEVLCADHDIDAEDNTALALFRTFQEALTNVTKHAQAGKVEVRLMQEGDEIVLEVSDDGRGVGSADLGKPKSFGLRSIRERLHALGGSMRIQPRVPRGTTVVLRAPVVSPPRREPGQ